MHSTTPPRTRGLHGTETFFCAGIPACPLAGCRARVVNDNHPAARALPRNFNPKRILHDRRQNRTHAI